jgi:predicted secreted protein with PEFG-CTERM motif
LRKSLIPLAILALSLLVTASAFAYSGGISGLSQNGCGGCHSNAGTAQVTLDGLPAQYEPGKTYTLTVTVSSQDVPGEGGGFDLSVTAGTLTPIDATTKIDGNDLTHTGAQRRSWSFNWTAPTQGDVTFYVAGLAANGDGGINGDAWTTYSSSVPVIPEFPGLTILIVLAAVALIILLAKKYY